MKRAREVAVRFNRVQVVENEVQHGKGYAVRTGVRRAGGSIVFVMDADLSVPIDHVGFFIDCFDSDRKIDIIVGNRRHPESVIEQRQARFREALGKSFTVFVRLFGLSALLDTQCGFKGFRRNASRAIYERQTVNGFACDVEVMHLDKTMGFRIEDMPVRWINSPDSRVRLLIDSLDVLIDLFRIRGKVRRTMENNPYEKGK